jgi:S1-C subfamily serine protease
VYDAEKGLIVTNAHVVDGSTEFAIGVEGESELRDAEIVGVAPCDDLAVLKVEETEGLRTMPLGSQSELAQGDRLLTLGYPGNGTTQDDLQVTDGVVSVVQTVADEPALNDADFAVYPNVVQTDAAINAGNSGGPSISEEGKLIGVNTLGSLQTQNQNFAIGVDRVKEIVPGLAEGNSRGWAGFGFAAYSREDLAAEGVFLDDGALAVTSVAPGTAAEDQEFYVNDLVTYVNGKRVGTRRQYCSALRGVESGDVIPVTVLDSVSNYARYYDLEVPFE